MMARIGRTLLQFPGPPAATSQELEERVEAVERKVDGLHRRVDDLERHEDERHDDERNKRERSQDRDAPRDRH